MQSTDDSALLRQYLDDHSDAAFAAPADALILRDPEMHWNSYGKGARFYAYGDGRIVEATSDDGNFDAWEKHLTSPTSTSQ